MVHDATAPFHLSAQPRFRHNSSGRVPPSAGGGVPPIRRLIVGGLVMTVCLALCSLAMIQNYVLAQQRQALGGGGQQHRVAYKHQNYQEMRKPEAGAPQHGGARLDDDVAVQPQPLSSHIRVGSGLAADVEAHVTNRLRIALIPFPNGDCTSLDVEGGSGSGQPASDASPGQEAGAAAAPRPWATVSLFANPATASVGKHPHHFVMCNHNDDATYTLPQARSDVMLQHVEALDMGATLSEDYAEALRAADGAVRVSTLHRGAAQRPSLTGACNVRLVWRPDTNNASSHHHQRQTVFDRSAKRHRAADALDESYHLCVEGTGGNNNAGRDDVLLTIVVARPIGVLHALRTFFQIAMGIAAPSEGLAHDGGGAVGPALPRRVRGCIHDAPKVPWRGLHLDTSRHFHDTATIKDVLRGMSRLKMNRFHWHLSDDQGWRLESRVYPGLHMRGSTRGGPLNGRKAQKYRGVPYPQPTYHTQDDVRAIVAYASQRGIVVVPEVDLPAHAAALIAGLAPSGNAAAFGGRVDAAQGNMDCGSDGTEAQRLGAPNCMGGTFGVMYPTQAAVSIATSILGELCALFGASPYVHLGGDEAEMIRDIVWGRQNAPRCDLKGCSGGGTRRDDYGYVQAMLTDALIAAVENTTVCPPAHVAAAWWGATAEGGADVGSKESNHRTVPRRAVVWDETILELVKGRVPESPHTLGMLWRDDRASIQDVVGQYQLAGGDGDGGVGRRGEAPPPRLILTPKTRLYFDYLQHSAVPANRYWPLQRPPPWLKTYKAVTLERSFMTHAMLPVQEWTSSIVYGVQGCLWTELIPNASVLVYQLYPRMYALADAGWSLRHEKDLGAGFKRLQVNIRRIEAAFGA